MIFNSSYVMYWIGGTVQGFYEHISKLCFYTYSFSKTNKFEISYGQFCVKSQVRSISKKTKFILEEWSNIEKIKFLRFLTKNSKIMDENFLFFFYRTLYESLRSTNLIHSHFQKKRWEITKNPIIKLHQSKNYIML